MDAKDKKKIFLKRPYPTPTLLPIKKKSSGLEQHNHQY